MTAFYLKLLITPALMLAISLAARRWGTGVAGLLSGLPMTSALVMLFLSIEQGTQFASMAVPGALAGLAAIQATYLFYFLVTRRVAALTGCVLALAVYGATAFLMNLLGLLALSIIFTLLMVALIIVATSKQAPPDVASYVALPRWVIPMRSARHRREDVGPANGPSEQGTESGHRGAHARYPNRCQQRPQYVRRPERLRR